MPRFWIGVAHRRQALMAHERGVVAFSHGKKPPVVRLGVGDRVIYYAPRTDFDGEAVQAFVALATVTGAAPEARPFGDGLTAWTRAAEFARVSEIPVRPMLPDLAFVTNKTHWGMAFRRGQFEIGQADFDLIAGAMGA